MHVEIDVYILAYVFYFLASTRGKIAKSKTSVVFLVSHQDVRLRH